MDGNPIVELEGQTSINELLDDPVGTLPIQLELPIPRAHPVTESGRPSQRL